MESVTYEDARNELIEHAERYANQTTGLEPYGKNYRSIWEFSNDHAKWVEQWNRNYYSKMNELVDKTLKNPDGSYKEHII